MNDMPQEQSEEGKDMESRFWFVVQTKPGQEHRANTNLTNQEIETFLPLFKAYQYSGGKMIQRIKPLFTSYLFVRFDIKIHYEKVKYTRGVNKILGSKEGPIPISEKVIETIKGRMGEDQLIRLDEDFKEGDKVQVTSGPLKDLMGVFQKKMSNKGRVRVLLGLIGVDVPVQISRWQIKRVA